MTTIPTSRPLVRVVDALLRLPRRAWIEAQIFVVRWNIVSAEDYILACSADGLVDSLSIRAWERQLEADRVHLALLRAQR